MYEIKDLTDLRKNEMVILFGIKGNLRLGKVQSINSAEQSLTIEGSSLEYYFEGGQVAVTDDEDYIAQNA